MLLPTTLPFNVLKNNDAHRHLSPEDSKRGSFASPAPASLLDLLSTGLLSIGMLRIAEEHSASNLHDLFVVAGGSDCARGLGNGAGSAEEQPRSSLRRLRFDALPALL